MARIGDLEQAVGSIPAGDGHTILRIDAVDPPGAGVPGVAVGPDQIVLSVDTGGAVHKLCRLDGRYLATEVAGGFTGRILGVGTVDGPARVLRFAYTARCGTRPLVIA